MSVPGKHLHTAGDGERDCKIELDGAPTVHCFHDHAAASWKALTMSCARGSAKRSLRPDYRTLRYNLEPPLSIKKMALNLLR